MALPMLTQNELIGEIADESGWSKGDVRRILDAISTVVTNNMQEGYRVKLAGVQIEPKVTPARKKRKGRNPATGEEVIIAAKPASVKVKTKVVKPLKDVKLPSVKKLQGMM